PDILVVDEVLAVGDADFQQKSIGKMESIGKTGRTVLFVSHSMPMILRLCPRTILLEHGKVIKDGPTPDVFQYYRRSGLGVSTHRQWDSGDVPGSDLVKLRSIRISKDSGLSSESIDIDC